MGLYKTQKVELTEEEIVFLIATLNPEEDIQFDIKMRLIDSLFDKGIVIDLAESEYTVKEAKVLELT